MEQIVVDGTRLHELTLMLASPSAPSHAGGDGASDGSGDGVEESMAPNLRILRCPECGRTETLDRALVMRGDYFCDGSGVYQYRVHRVDIPGISHVFDKAREEAAEEQLAFDKLMLIVARISEGCALLQEWVTEYIEG